MDKLIYMVEDEENLNILLKKYLENEGYKVKSFSDGTSVLSHIGDNPSLWILDIMLPDTDGYELIKRIKSHNKDARVIFMSARNEELDRVIGLELGSDDYLSKPFLPRELVIRVNRLFERMEEKNTNSYKEYISGEYRISTAERSVYCGKTEIQLTNNEFELLIYFVKNKNIVLSREQILDNVWGSDYFGSDRVVDDTIRRLRKKLSGLSLDTVYGYGYRLH